MSKPCGHITSDKSNVSNIGELKQQNVGVKDDKGKPPARYLYWPGLAALPAIDQDMSKLFRLYHSVLIKLPNFKENQSQVICALYELSYACSFVWAKDTKLFPSIQNRQTIYVEYLKEISTVSAAGANKYAWFNYRQGMKWSRLFDAMGRHLLGMLEDNHYSEDMDLHHLLHVGANILMLADYIDNRLGTQDVSDEDNKV